MDTERIRRKALERGLITAADAERMPPAKVHQLIWEPGLSTAEKVTEVSGRGMGMDIVRSKIEDLSGTVEVESTPGRGTTFSIKLPLTLAILPSLMVEIAGDVFAMPLEAVVEIVRLQRRELTTVHRQWTARVRQRVISLVRLGDVFASAAAAGDAGDPGEESTVVIFGRQPATNWACWSIACWARKTSSSSRWRRTSATSPASPGPASSATAASR